MILFSLELIYLRLLNNATKYASIAITSFPCVLRVIYLKLLIEWMKGDSHCGGSCQLVQARSVHIEL